MTKTFAETLLFASVAINAAFLIFLAGVYRKMMNAVDGPTFKTLTALLYRYSAVSPFMIIVLNLPFIGAIPYYYFYGFGNWWLTSGLIIWLVAGSIAKAYKVPAYKASVAIKKEDDDPDHLNKLRSKLNIGNSFQAILYTVATVVMALGFVKFS
jgi:hypothetical protein